MPCSWNIKYPRLDISSILLISRTPLKAPPPQKNELYKRQYTFPHVTPT